MFDIDPAASRLADLVGSTTDADLDRPTPCADVTVAGLLAHIEGFAHAFTLAARKEPIDGGAVFDPELLTDGWADRIPAALHDLAKAWSDPAAREGMTDIAGPVPGEIGAVITLDEIVLHGWDLAVALGRTTVATDEELDVLEPFVAQAQAPGSGADDGGLFGPPVDAPAGASRFDRLLAGTGRDPRWRPPT